MEKIKELNTSTKYLFGFGILFLVYGFLSRIIPINLFWESKSIGWTLIFIGLITLIYAGIEKRKKTNKKTIWNKVGIGFICFILFVQMILIITIPNTDAYAVSKKYLMQDIELKKEIGEITGFGLIPSGGLSIQTDSNGKTGNANLNIIVKGTKAYKSVNIGVFKDYGEDWKVYGMN